MAPACTGGRPRCRWLLLYLPMTPLAASPAPVPMTVMLLPPPRGLEPFVKAIALRRRRRPGLPGGRLAHPQSFAANAYTVLTFCHNGALHDPTTQRRLQPFEVTGAMSGPVWRSYEEQPEVTTVFLNPGAGYRLLRTSADALAERSEEASPLLPAGMAAEWVERLALARSTLEQVREVEALLVLLARRVIDDRRTAAPLSWPAQAHLGTVTDLARRLDLGPRQLHRRALAEVGLAPKQLLRIQRAHRCIRTLRRAAEQPAPPRWDWDALAQAHGYADRAHLRRDFQALVGVTPAEVLRDWRAEQPHYWDFEP